MCVANIMGIKTSNAMLYGSKNVAIEAMYHVAVTPWKIQCSTNPRILVIINNSIKSCSTYTNVNSRATLAIGSKLVNILAPVGLVHLVAYNICCLCRREA